MMEIIIAMLEKMVEDVDYRVREIDGEKPEHSFPNLSKKN